MAVYPHLNYLGTYIMNSSKPLTCIQVADVIGIRLGLHLVLSDSPIKKVGF